jgi:hypothetical protein
VSLLLPAGRQSTSWPCSTSRAPTAAPISPGCSSPTRQPNHLRVGMRRKDGQRAPSHLVRGAPAPLSAVACRQIRLSGGPGSVTERNIDLVVRDGLPGAGSRRGLSRRQNSAGSIRSPRFRRALPRAFDGRGYPVPHVLANW